MDFTKSQYWDFSKGNPMIFVKSCKFPLCLFSHKMNFEIMFDDHPVRKQALLKYKNIEFIELPNPFFCSKGIKPRFWSKVGIFLFACFWTKWALKWCFLIIQLENKPSQTKKYLFNTVDILTFSRGLTHDFGQNWRFHLSLVLDKIRVEIMSDDNPSRKEALLNHKNINFTKSPNCIFSIRLTHDFRQKLQVSSLFRNFLLVCFWTIEA